MRFINKNSVLELLYSWRQQNRLLPNNCFKHLTQNVRSEIIKTLLKEQCHLCAYTGKRIVYDTDEISCHIEHMIPQSVSIAEGRPTETTDYTNMVLCDNSPDYGAKIKADWPNEIQKQLFLKPTNITCETRIIYKKNGKAEPANNEDEAAKTTIKKLNLNHSQLVDNRRSAYLNLFLVKIINKQYLTKRLAEAQNVLNDKLEEFAFVKKQYLEKKLTQCVH